eukprot:6184995-Pleurochrysis_carterae.AAC.3
MEEDGVEFDGDGEAMVNVIARACVALFCTSASDHLFLGVFLLSIVENVVSCVISSQLGAELSVDDDDDDDDIDSLSEADLEAQLDAEIAAEIAAQKRSKLSKVTIFAMHKRATRAAYSSTPDVPYIISSTAAYFSSRLDETLDAREPLPLHRERLLLPLTRRSSRARHALCNARARALGARDLCTLLGPVRLRFHVCWAVVLFSGRASRPRCARRRALAQTMRRRAREYVNSAVLALSLLTDAEFPVACLPHQEKVEAD